MQREKEKKRVEFRSEQNALLIRVNKILRGKKGVRASANVHIGDRLFIISSLRVLAHAHCISLWGF